MNQHSLVTYYLKYYVNLYLSHWYNTVAIYIKFQVAVKVDDIEGVDKGVTPVWNFLFDKLYLDNNLIQQSNQLYDENDKLPRSYQIRTCLNFIYLFIRGFLSHDSGKMQVGTPDNYPTQFPENCPSIPFVTWYKSN